MAARLRCAIYVRVSTTARTSAGADAFIQNPEVQEQPLREYARTRGWDVVQVYSDRVSGAAKKRPGLDALMGDVRRGKIDVVVVWRFDRFARSVMQLISALEEFRCRNVAFVSQQELLDTATPMGEAMFTIIAAMAQLERAIIRERIANGLEFAQQNGTKSGKPVGRPKLVLRRDKVVEMRSGGVSWNLIAKELGLGATTVRRVYREETGRGLTLCQNLRSGGAE